MCHSTVYAFSNDVASFLIFTVHIICLVSFSALILLRKHLYNAPGIPMGLYFAFWLDMGLHGLWLGLTFSLIYCAFLGTWISMRTDWNREVTMVMQRLKDEGKAHLEDMERSVNSECLA